MSNIVSHAFRQQQDYLRMYEALARTLDHSTQPTDHILLQAPSLELHDAIDLSEVWDPLQEWAGDVEVEEDTKEDEDDEDNEDEDVGDLVGGCLRAFELVFVLLAL